MPNRSPVLAEANGNRIVLDLMRDPNVGKNALVRRAVSLLTSFVTLHGVETDKKHVDIAFRALPSGLGGAVKSLRNNVVLPSMSRLLPRAR
jgi:cobalamin synthase